MSEVRLVSSMEGPDGAPVLVIADSGLRVIRGTSHLAPYQTPGPVTAAILSHLGVPAKLR